jgi:hypothetical protein
VHDAKHGQVVPQQPDRDRRAAPPLDEFARSILRIDEPPPAGERPGAEAGLLAEEIAWNDRLQAAAQAFFDFGVDRRLAAGSARPVGAAELGVQSRALVFDERDYLEEDGCEIQPVSACAVRGGKRGAGYGARKDARPGGGN